MPAEELRNMQDTLIAKHHYDDKIKEDECMEHVARMESPCKCTQHFGRKAAKDETLRG